jgi:hypothetical protein
MVKCAVVRLRVLLARHSARLISDRPTVLKAFAFCHLQYSNPDMPPKGRHIHMQQHIKERALLIIISYQDCLHFPLWI